MESSSEKQLGKFGLFLDQERLGELSITIFRNNERVALSIFEILNPLRDEVLNNGNCDSIKFSDYEDGPWPAPRWEVDGVKYQVSSGISRDENAEINTLHLLVAAVRLLQKKADPFEATWYFLDRTDGLFYFFVASKTTIVLEWVAIGTGLGAKLDVLSYFQLLNYSPRSRATAAYMYRKYWTQTETGKIGALLDPTANLPPEICFEQILEQLVETRQLLESRRPYGVKLLNLQVAFLIVLLVYALFIR